jgi:hypothetical protein
MFLRRFRTEPDFVPALVRSDVLQLTFRDVKVNLPMLALVQRPCQKGFHVTEPINDENR